MLCCNRVFVWVCKVIVMKVIISAHHNFLVTFYIETVETYHRLYRTKKIILKKPRKK